jgi:hypothetical protein
MKGPTARRATTCLGDSPKDDEARAEERARRVVGRSPEPTSLPASPRTLAPKLRWVPFADLAGALRRDD